MNDILWFSLTEPTAADDPRATHYFSPRWRDGLSDASREWWQSLPESAGTDEELEKRYHLRVTA